MARIEVTPQQERRARLSQAAPLGSTERIPFQGGYRELPTVRVSIDIPVYRMANMRTSVVQRDHVAQRSLPPDFFSAGQENPSAQQAQHDLLVKLSHHDGADIYGVLKEAAEQSEPLVVTTDGVVLNGNRRLAAMRELFASNPQQYNKFSHVELALLPDEVNEDDLTDIETELQIKPDMRLDYGWVEEALGLRRQQADLGWSWARIEKAWGLKRKELDARLESLKLGEEYLEKYLQRPGEYGRLEAHEQAFMTLTQVQLSAIAQKVDEPLREAARYMTYAVLDQQVEGRTYDYARQSLEITRRVAATLRSTGVVDADTHPGEVDDPLADPTEDATSPIGGAVVAYLRDVANRDELARQAQDAREMLRDEASVARRGGAALASAQKINSLAANLSLGAMDPTTASSTLAQLLAGIELVAVRLKELLLAHPSNEVMQQVRLREVRALLDSLDEHQSEQKQ